METRSARAVQLAEQVGEQTDDLANTAASTLLSSPTRNELVRYVLMPLQKIRTFAADANFSVESFTKEIRTAWKADIFSKAYRLRLINHSISL